MAKKKVEEPGIIEKARLERLCANEDFKKFMTDIVMDYGGFHFVADEVDAFHQGEMAMLNRIKGRLLLANNGPMFLAGIDMEIFNFNHEIRVAQVLGKKKETK